MTFTDPFVTAERYLQRGLRRLPPWFSRWFGFRGEPMPPSPTYIVCLWGFVGAFGGLGILLAIFAHTDYFTSRNVPPIVASYVGLSHTCLSAAFG